MNEQIKIGLLGIIAATLIVQTAMQMGGDSGSSTAQSASLNPAAADNSTPLDLNLDDPANAQPVVPPGPKTMVQFDESNFDFGTIKQNTTNLHIFKFKNSGAEPLVIANAVGSCGCTVPEYPKDPIPPGGTGEIKVEYKPGTQKGNQTKTVTVTANTEPAQTRINISAFVEEDPSAAAGAEVVK